VAEREIGAARNAAALLAIGAALLQQEAACLDEQRWDDWLALYSEDCEYWVPTWKDDEALASDPRAEISHIYYSSRAGLEDRVLRLRSGKSPASLPLPRTAHMLGAILPIESPDAARMRLRASWTTHVYFPRSAASHAFFGRSEQELILRGGAWRIQRKKIVLANDYIPAMLDVYCL
jgi:3-phenylpropionate/cinnamic acid dioxygenase small subunit